MMDPILRPNRTNPFIYESVDTLPALRDGGLAELQTFYAKWRLGLISALETAKSPEDIVEITRQLQGVLRFLSDLAEHIKELKNNV